MSTTPVDDPVCSRAAVGSVITNIIEARARDLGGFTVRRVLPASARRLVGPFIFFDHMGPTVFAPGGGIDVRPHPHIGLATVTYLFEGEIVHRDSLGSLQPIRPGDINWMTAGRGIVHSERTAPERRRDGAKLHGLQLWVALPAALEETEPAFVHYPAASLPVFEHGAVRGRVLAGAAFGVTSPVTTQSPLVYADAIMPPATRLTLPVEIAERAVYVVDGAVDCGGQPVEAGSMLVFAQGATVVLDAGPATRIVLVGGAPLDGDRHIDWNFVSSSSDRIARARRDWQEGRFPKVPGDEHDFIPLPELQ